MPIDIFCESCQKKLRVPDTAAGKRIKCPKCQGVISVPGGEIDAPAPHLSSPAIPTPSRLAASKSSSSISLPTPKASTPGSKIAARALVENWFVQTEDGEQYGPVSRDELNAWFGEGRITAETQLLKEGSAQWQWATDVFPELAAATAPAASSGFPAFGEATSSSGGSGAFNFGDSGSGATSSVTTRGKAKKGGKVGRGGKRGGGSPHIDYIAYCEYAMGGMGILVCILMIVMGGTIAGALSGVNEKGAAEVGAAAGGVFIVIALFGMVMSCIWFAAAYGMQQRASWGRLLTLILAILGAISLSPINIAFAVWCYTVLTDKDNQAVFR